MKNYVTFGQEHRHIIGKTVYDRNCVATYESETQEEGRAFAFSVFGDKFCFHTVEPRVPEMVYFPRGFIGVLVPLKEAADAKQEE
jgi:hypothetical protein